MREKPGISIFVVGVLISLLQVATLYIGNDLRDRIVRVENYIMQNGGLK